MSRYHSFMLRLRPSALFTLAAVLAVPAYARAQEVVPDKPAPSAPAKPAPAAAQPKPASKPADANAKTAAPPPVAAAPTAKPPEAKPPPAAATPAVPEAPKKVVRKGKAPRRPSPTAPAGAQRNPPNEAARKRISGGALPATARGADDPELAALRAAERVLFPKPLPGSTSGWSWDLPKPPPSSEPEVAASGLPPALTLDPSLGEETSVASDAEWIRSLTLPDLPVRLESPVVRYLKFYRDDPKGKAIARVWAKKSGRYVPALKAELAKAGLPTDLVWLSLIESGHNPSIVSSAGAAGLWQFMPEAGRLYGLTVDRWVDERFDPKRATEGAILYLSDLHRRFGNWELAMAAYNMGYAGLTRAIRKFNSNDYWELCRYEAGIPWETTLYVPKIFAIAVVMTNPRAFGLDGVTADPPESLDRVPAPPGLPLADIAAAAGVPLATIEGLNTQLLSGRVPPALSKSRSTFKVRVPSGTGKRVSQALAKLGEPEPELQPYSVRMGDTLASIAAARGAEPRTIGRVNRLKDDEHLEAGTVLLVPRGSGGHSTAAAPAEVVVISPRQFSYPDRKRVFYRVQAGDTLAKIGQAFGVSRSELESWNALDPTARLHSGMTLSVWVRPGTNTSAARVHTESDVRVLVAGTPEFFDYFEGQNGKTRLTVEARNGDTLASLGRRYGMSTGWMERINRRSRKKELKPGEKVVVYVPSAMAARVAAAERKAPPPPEVAPVRPASTTADAPLVSDEPTPSDKPAPVVEIPPASESDG